MQEAEVFHLYHSGEQRGPYSARQINHQYRCGYIDDETLYWREGMEQWQPVTEIVDRRRRRRKHRLMRWGVAMGILAGLAFLVVLFGPTTRDAWRELTSGEFTVESAWWRARGLVREKLGAGESVTFGPFTDAKVTLLGSDRAEVMIPGQLTTRDGKKIAATWKVRLWMDPVKHRWQAAPSTFPTPPPPSITPVLPASS